MMKNKKKLLYIIIFFIVICLLIYEVKDFKELCDIQKDTSEMILKGENNKNKQESIYASLARKYKNIDNLEKMKNPYIPNGFKHIEGTWETGYVIEDENQNQFVWVPCSGNENNINFIKKYYFLKEAEKEQMYQMYDDSAQKFLESAYENGGYYIGRFETGIENGNPVIKKDVEIYNNLEYSKAEKIAIDMYDKNEDINSSLINMFAYDVALNWCVEKNNIDALQIGKNVREKEDDKFITGKVKYNNIYDLIDTVWELCYEKFYDFRVSRGVALGEEPEITRQALNENFISDNLTFRIILYK